MINITSIYLIEGIENSPYKVYIGKSKNLQIRFKQHQKTYGDNITLKVIDKINSLDRKDWGPLETKWIQHYINIGYDVINLNKKGGGGPEFHTDVTKLKQRLVKLGKTHIVNKVYINKGVPKSKEFGLLISKSKKGKSYSNKYKCVLQYDLNDNFIKEWESGKIACKETNISNASICWCCKGKLKTAGRFIWKFKIN